MKFIDSIFSLVWDIKNFFYNAYLEVKGWIIPFRYLSTPLYALYKVCWDLTTPIAQFADWVDDVAAKVGSILSQANIISFLSTWLIYAENAWSWITSAWQNVTNIINTWWSSASQVVVVWVNEAKQYATSLYSDLNALVLNLQAAWDSFKGKLPAIEQVLSWWGNWWGNILPSLTSWWNNRLLDIQSLINSAFITRQGLWAGWQDWRGKVVEFFSDPLEFLLNRFYDWFLGPEE